ncbi:MAG: molybdopterin-guanine dinucleotide biosynthesis protein B [Nitrospiraceae bacterium]|nr:molybdopterin-guanine dinucleotide biosynthesis protein B [Nitrospiraceae bacterium]MDA8105845.1 molybdopterin-guanine dinucleotide biosynthesis protein B [Nitrospiraceae bacterium]
MNSACIVVIAGYSGAGKTTLIERILPELKKEGLSVGVLKHTHHKLNPDVKGKDSDRFFRAGADFVFAHDARQVLARHRNNNENFSDLVRKFPAVLDLIIVEGHKDIDDIPGIWLEAGPAGKRNDKTACRNRKAGSRGDPRCHRKALACIREEMESFHSKRPLMAGLLIGGKSTRMGTPKALLKMKGKTLAEGSFSVLSAVSGKTVLLGSGQLPESLKTADRLPDVRGVEGPLSGILSAFRWAPESAWIISSVDMPCMHKRAWEWLLSQRKPGVWAVLPKIKGSKGVETTGAVYEPMIFEHVESLAREGITTLQEIARHPKVMTPVIPESFSAAWSNVNTLAEWKKTLLLHLEKG